MKLDLDAVEEHAKYIAAVRKRRISWRVSVGASGLVTLVFEDSQGEPIEVAGAETFAVMPQSSAYELEELLTR